jgi:hypothetical protein
MSSVEAQTIPGEMQDPAAETPPAEAEAPNAAGD